MSEDPQEGFGSGLTNEFRMSLLVKAAARLREHFSSVQIVACRPEDGNRVTHFEAGNGSWYERYGSMRYWLLMEEEADRERARQKVRDE